MGLELRRRGSASRELEPLCAVDPQENRSAGADRISRKTITTMNKNIQLALAQVADTILMLYSFALIAVAVMSFVSPDPRNPIVRFLDETLTVVLLDETPDVVGTGTDVLEERGITLEARQLALVERHRFRPVGERLPVGTTHHRTVEQTLGEVNPSAGCALELRHGRRCGRGLDHGRRPIEPVLR